MDARSKDLQYFSASVRDRSEVGREGIKGILTEEKGTEGIPQGREGKARNRVLKEDKGSEKKRGEEKRREEKRREEKRRVEKRREEKRREAERTEDNMRWEKRR